jgi:GDP-L-fucose synthase
MADACVFIMESGIRDGWINVGTGVDVTIRELVEMISDMVNFVGYIEFDSTKPDGTPQKLLDVSKLRQLGWSAKVDLRNGLKQTYRDFLNTLS